MKPRVKLVGENGNVYNLIRLCKKAAYEAGWSFEKIDAFVQRVYKARDYDDALCIMMDEFEVY